MGVKEYGPLYIVKHHREKKLCVIKERRGVTSQKHTHIPTRLITSPVNHCAIN